MTESEMSGVMKADDLETKLASIIYWRMYPESPRHPGKHFPVERPQETARRTAREIIVEIKRLNHKDQNQ